ncbi:MAG: PAS domain-containing protein [Cyanobacteriota bacterium]
MSERRASILVVDDQPDNLRTLSAILRTEGYKVRQAISGEMALDTVGSQCPDIILLDIKMPLMDGYAVCSSLKASAATCEIPVIFLSALEETADKVKAFAIGGADYITKPFHAEEVIARVNNQLRLSRLSQQLAEQNARLIEEIQVRQIAETALKESEARLKLALEATQTVCWERDLTTDRILLSSTVANASTPLEISYLEALAVVHPDDREQVHQANQDAIATRSSFAIEHRVPVDEQLLKWKWVLAKGKVLVDETGKPTRLIGVSMDITDQKKAQEALLIAQKRLEYLLSSSPSVIFTAKVTEPYSATFISENFFELFGYEPQESLKDENFWVTRLHPEDKAKIFAEIPQLIKRGHHTFEYRFLHKDGTYRWIYEPCKLIRDDEGNPLEIIGSMSDITARKQIEAALQESQHWLQAITEANPNILYLYDLIEQQIVYVNREVCTILGYTPEEIFQMKSAVVCNLLHPDDKAAISERLKKSKKAEKGDIFEYEYRMRNKDGEWRWLFSRETVLTTTADGQPKQILGTATDISERKLAEARERAKAQELEQTLKQLKHTQAQLIQTEKMSSLGRMVAGVAHEINNPVSFIYANINPAMEYTDELLKLMQLYAKHYPNPVAEISEQLEIVEPDFIAEDFPKLLTSMKEGAERITQIVLSLRNFSRLDQADCKQVDIHEGINSTLNILQHRLKSKCDCPEIQVIKEYGQLPLVECYPGQLNQVFMNIISNAIDTLRDAQGSLYSLPREASYMVHSKEQLINNEQLTINTPSHELSTINYEQLPTIRIHSEVVEPNRVAIRIADNGSGIKPEILPQIFDPFFTTKSVGIGTGLGLSTSYQVVVNQHGGQLMCHSTPKQGTEFVIELPIAQCKASVKIEYD